MKTIKIKCPAKINLDLRVYKKNLKTGFHPIKSIMQTINLFDFLSIKLLDNNSIILSGNSDEIPYDERNICFSAAKKFFEKIKSASGAKIYIEKNIPVCAGLAGGSSDAAGVLYGLNKLFNNPLKQKELHALAFELGSDLNFCLEGGTKLCTGRGEKMVNMPFYNFKLSIVKPKNLKISAKEAYEEFDKLDSQSSFRNDLEFALVNKYEQINFLSSLGLQMTGSGPAFFLRNSDFNIEIDKNEYIIINGLNSVNHGVIEDI